MFHLTLLYTAQAVLNCDADRLRRRHHRRGAAGLAAAAQLKRSGVDVRCLEAGDRIGGRILTVRDPLAPFPIELGAEFVHGRPPETWQLIRDAGLVAYEHTSPAVHLRDGKIVREKEVGQVAEGALANFAKARRKDVSFEDYLRHSRQTPEAKKWARIHIEGFNAARSEWISATSLAQDGKAADEIEGDRTFRVLGGYDSIAQILMRSIPEAQSVIQLNSIVKNVSWRRGFVEVRYRSAPRDEQVPKLRCLGG